MSEFTAIRGVSEALKALLKRYTSDTSDSSVGSIGVDLRSPRELRGSGNVISVWLYQVERNAEVHNRPPQRVSPTRLEYPGFPLNLHYLVTPIASSAEVEHALMGRILQVLDSWPTLRDADLDSTTLEGTDAVLRLSFQPLALEELTRVWDALNEPYQLSVAYLVQMVTIDSLRAIETGPNVRDAGIRVGGSASP